ncbi:MAG: 1-acyl-sn-glycerol-3-phosphate acyltransferase [Crocinitomicaceae bacterium]|jgi:1-acyl-sn-glycerol-3-phosphate acyltransferase
MWGAYMVRLIRYLLLSIHFVVGSLIGLLAGFIRPFHPSNSRVCAQTYSKIGLPIIGIKVHHEGKENYPINKSFIVICNHQSNWDLFVVGSIVPKRTVSIGKKSLKWVPLFGQLYWLAGNILIDRGNAKKAMDAMAATKTALTKKRTNIWFFAEGTRNNGKNMLPFKKGAFVTAINAGVPIVPVCSSAYLDDFSFDRIKNNDAYLRVLPAVDTTGMTNKDIPALMEKCHAEMMEVISELSAKAAAHSHTADS